jgi:hypothetical protein
MHAERDIHPNYSGRYRIRGDRLIADLAGHQHGVVSREQLLDAGVDRHLLDHRVIAGRLHVVYHGVYSVGHRALPIDGRRMAAALAAGPSAVLSHRTAAAVWQLKPSEHLEVTAPTERRRPGIRMHRSSLLPDEMTAVRGIPVTTVPRTVLDLAGVLPRYQLERVLNETEIRGLKDRLSLADLVARHPGRRGLRTLRQILDQLQAGTTVTHSELEDRFLAFIRKTGLPPPSLNARPLGFECDCVWHDERIVVELDGRATHDTAAAFERDRARDRALAAGGWRTVRITWRQLHEEPELVAADLRSLLGMRRCEAS